MSGRSWRQFRFRESSYRTQYFSALKSSWRFKDVPWFPFLQLKSCLRNATSSFCISILLSQSRQGWSKGKSGSKRHERTSGNSERSQILNVSSDLGGQKAFHGLRAISAAEKSLAGECSRCSESKNRETCSPSLLDIRRCMGRKEKPDLKSWINCGI